MNTNAIWAAVVLCYMMMASFVIIVITHNDPGSFAGFAAAIISPIFTGLFVTYRIQRVSDKVDSVHDKMNGNS